MTDSDQERPAADRFAEKVLRERIAAHWRDTLVLAEEVIRTTRVSEALRLSKVVGHLGRAQVLLAQELNEPPTGSKPETAHSVGEAADPEVTPLDGIRLEARGRSR